MSALTAPPSQIELMEQITKGAQEEKTLLTDTLMKKLFLMDGETVPDIAET